MVFARFFAPLAAPLLACTLMALASPATAQAASKVKFVTSEGDFVVEVYRDKAPKTVENFLQYVKDKHYDGTVFHRVISNFMVQGGGYDAAYAEKKTRPPVAHEGQAALAKGGSKNVVGTLAMARTNDPNSASSQFFINVKDNDFLNPTVIPPGDPVPKFEFQGRVYEIRRARSWQAPPNCSATRCLARSPAAWMLSTRSRNCRPAPVGRFPLMYPKRR